MKTFKNFLIEQDKDSLDTFNRSVKNTAKFIIVNGFKNNYLAAIDSGKLLFRGSSRYNDIFDDDLFAAVIEKKTTDRKSVYSTDNFFINFVELYCPDSSRKQSIFCTSQENVARSDFGTTYIIIPHDSISKFSKIDTDFNFLTTQSSDTYLKTDTGYSISDSFMSLSDDLNTMLSEYNHMDFYKKFKNLKEFNTVFEKLKNQKCDKNDFEVFYDILQQNFSNPEFRKEISKIARAEIKSLLKYLKQGKTVKEIFESIGNELKESITIFKSFKTLLSDLNEEHERDEIWWEGTSLVLKVRAKNTLEAIKKEILKEGAGK